MNKSHTDRFNEYRKKIGCIMELNQRPLIEPRPVAQSRLELTADGPGWSGTDF